MYRILLILLSCLLAYTEAKITTCDSPVGHVNPADVRISGCHPNDDECPLKCGTDLIIEFDFTIKKPVRSVSAVVYGYLWIIPKSFDLPDTDVCMHSNTTGVHCPLSHDDSTFHYRTNLPISSDYPKLSVTVEWMLKNEDGENIVCLMIPAKLT